MNTANRNQPCPCGSNKRFKHCCGSGTGARAPRTRFQALDAHREGLLGRAETLYRAALQEDANDVDVLHMLGVVQMQRFHHREALESLWQCAEMTQWAAPDVLHNLGLLLAKLIAGTANRRQEQVLAAFVDREKKASQSTSLAITPLVTVVMPTYNHAAYVAQAIESVAAQTYRPIELVIIDDGSSDDTREVIARCLRDIDIPARFIARENRGAHATLNEGAALANGEYLAFLNSDDYYAPERIACMVDQIARTGLVWGFSKVTHVGEKGRSDAAALSLMEQTYRDRYRGLTGRHSNSIALYEYNLAISTGNLFVDREFFHRVGGFRDFRYNHDWDFCLRASALAEPWLVKHPLYHYRVHASNTISESQRKALRDADHVFSEFLATTLDGSARCTNPLAPHAPENRSLLLKIALGVGHGKHIPVPVLRALADDYRSSQSGRKTSDAIVTATPPPRRTALIVLGMHRSGTSALSRVLNLCGAFLPANLSPPKLGNNPKGFWEPEAITKLNERLLAQMGGAWNKVDFTLPDSGELVDDFLDDACTLLEAEYGGQDTILIKDPRMGVLAPLWHRALLAAGYRPVYVVPVRNPAEVAQSLHARGDMTPGEGMHLWHAYQTRIEAFAATVPDTIHGNFGDLLNDWRALVRRISDRLDVPLDIRKHADAVDSFLDPALRHHQTEDETVAEDAEFAPMRALYQSLLDECATEAANHRLAGGISREETGSGETRPAQPDPSVTFVLCIEDNAIRSQALLLCESIRRFGGRYRDAPIFAFAPRPGLGIDAATRKLLDAMDVRYVDEPLNTECREYGSANRVFAAEWAEKHCHSDFIVVLDSDTVFLGEPDLPTSADIAVRPVDTKGSATSGHGDHFEAYWVQLAGLCGTNIDRLPYIRTSVTHENIRASYNGGLVVVRREAGILGRWADLFRRSIRLGIKPYRGIPASITASTGDVGPMAAQHWGSNQAALAVVIWADTDRVLHYPATYNVPLHMIRDGGQVAPAWRLLPPVHIHYHWMLTPSHHVTAMRILETLGVPPDRLAWLARRTPLPET